MKGQEIVLEGWTWDLQEQSNGVYRASFTSRHGPKVEKTGTDEDELFYWCLAAAKDIDQQLSLKFKK